MGLLFRKAVWRILKVPTVALIDHDGEVTTAFARRDVLGGWSAYRWYAINRKVRLMPDGTCRGISYVYNWVAVVGAIGARQ